MKEGKVIDLESKEAGTLRFISVVKKLDAEKLKNFFDPKQKQETDEHSALSEKLNEAIKNANPNAKIPLSMGDLKKVILDTLEHVVKNTDDADEKAETQQKITAINPLKNKADSPKEFHAYYDEKEKLKYIHHIKSENGQEKTVWWARVKDDGVLSYFSRPDQKKNDELKNYKKVDFTVDIPADLPDKGRESVIKNGAREAIKAKEHPDPEKQQSQVSQSAASSVINQSSAAKQSPSRGTVMGSVVTAVTPGFEEQLFKYGGSLSKNEKGTFFYKHTDGGNITRETSGIWRGTPATADNLATQTEHLANDALALIRVDLANQEAATGKRDAPINLKMDGVTNNEQREALEGMVRQRIAQKIKNDPTLKDLKNPINVNGLAVKAAPVMSVQDKENKAPGKSVSSLINAAYGPKKKPLPVPPSPHPRLGKG